MVNFDDSSKHSSSSFNELDDDMHENNNGIGRSSSIATVMYKTEDVDSRKRDRLNET